MILWIAGAFIAWAGLVISIEFGAMLPRSGGIKVYLEVNHLFKNVHYTGARSMSLIMIATATEQLSDSAS